MAKKKSEADIQLEILKYLRSKGILSWRFSPQTYNASIGRHIKHEYIPNGLPDIMAITDDGFIGLEVKEPTNGKKSGDQILMQKRFRALGVEYHFVESVEDVETVLHDTI